MLTFFSSALALLWLCVTFSLTRAAEINVVVGGPGILRFTPENVTAAAGDSVVFSFHEVSHSATQSSLSAPCVASAGGFNSGLMPVTTGGPYPTMAFNVTDTSPVWFFCEQVSHCQSGMVFAINPGPGQFAQFKAAATGATPPATASSTTGASPSATSPGTKTSAATQTSSGSYPSRAVANNVGWVWSGVLAIVGIVAGMAL